MTHVSTRNLLLDFLAFFVSLVVEWIHGAQIVELIFLAIRLEVGRQQG